MFSAMCVTNDEIRPAQTQMTSVFILYSLFFAACVYFQIVYISCSFDSIGWHFSFGAT